VSDDSQLWLQQFFRLGLLTALVHLLQATCGILLWVDATSPALLAFGMDAIVGAGRELILVRRIARYDTADVDPAADGTLFHIVGGGYILVGLIATTVAVTHFWQGRVAEPTLLGVALAATSMLIIPIIGSYMKSLAMEVRSPALKQAAIFTFGNSYLSMVLLIGVLINAGMERAWGDPLCALVMSPFIIHKGAQLLAEGRVERFTE
jgi:hypothetical protein